MLLLTESIDAQRHALRLEQFLMTQRLSDVKQETPYDEEPKANERPNQDGSAKQVLLRRARKHRGCAAQRALRKMPSHASGSGMVRELLFCRFSFSWGYWYSN